ncbi:MAG TPA: pseudouridine synthase [Clostridiales bacterium]|nr:pseudouridine synthase [Clostridiales bacterium]
MRLNKYISHSGYTSRRKADDLIFQGKVKVNNKVEKNPGYRVDVDKDVVTVEGKELKQDNKIIYIMLNKPTDVITSVDDQFDRKTVVDLVKIDERVYPVGRLDYDSSGLILLTNDGDLTYKLTHPKHEIYKKYFVKVNKFLSDKEIYTLKKGVVIDGYMTNNSKIEVISKNRGHTNMYVSIDEGRNRQIRKMFKTQGADVLTLKRISIGNLTLGNLKEGNWRYLTKHEINYLKSL